MSWFDDLVGGVGDVASNVWDWGSNLLGGSDPSYGSGGEFSWLNALPSGLGESAQSWGSYLDAESPGWLEAASSYDPQSIAFGTLMPEANDWSQYLSQQPVEGTGLMGALDKGAKWLDKNEKSVLLAMRLANLAQGLFGGDRKLSPLEQQQQALNMARMQAQMRQLEANRTLPKYEAQRTLYNPQVTNRYGRSQQPQEARFMDTAVIQKAHGGIVDGATGGQDDVVPILGSHGEYVLDASTVSDLGDGNTTAGAERLDEMVEAVRRHKRGRRTLPPMAKSPLEYMQ